jgi:LPS-assembly protein
VMRRARKLHAECGSTRVCSRHMCRRQRTFALGSLATLALLILASLPSLAQDPSLYIGNGPPRQQSSFPKQPGGMFGPAPKIDQAQPLYLQADQLLYDTKSSRVIAQGNVEIYYNNFVLTADQVVYDQSTNKLIAEGNAQLKDPNGSITRADRFEALDDFRDAFIQSLSVVTADNTRIAAERANRREGNTTEYEKGKFTPCKNDPGVPPLWCISAARIIHDQRSATLIYQDAQFEFFGIPVVYLPYFEHPDPSVRHRSGFLMPNFSNSSTLGFGFELPYYFALAPNYDFTFTPKYWSNYGTLLQGEWRGSVQTKGQFSLSSWWRFGWDVTLDSDDSFRRFYQLDSILQTDRVNTVYLQGMSDRNYFSAKLYQFGGLLLTDTPYSNSWVHPVIDYNYIVGSPVVGGELSFTAHARSMTRSDGIDTNVAVVEANWRRQMIDPIGQVWTPFLNARGEIYNYNNGIDPITLAPLSDNTLALGIGAAGVLYSYPFVANSSFGSHVIAPTAQIIVRQNTVDQLHLPNEDAKSLVFDDTLLFEIDKFSGYDRMETGTRANVGVQYTFQGNGGTYARAVVGQSIQVAGVNPYSDPGLDPTLKYNFSPVNGLGTTQSDYVAGVYVSPFAGLGLISQARFDQRDWTLRRQDTGVTASYGPLTGTAAYTYTGFDPITGLVDRQEEIMTTLNLKLTTNWSVLGAMRYDIDLRQRIQDSIGLKYADECFVLSATYIETFVENAALDLKPDRTVMLRFELKNIGSYSYNGGAHIFGDQNLGPKL